MTQHGVRERLKLWLAVGVPIMALIYVHFTAQIMMFRIDEGETAARVLDIYGKPDKTEPIMLFCDGIFAWQGACPTEHHQSYHFYKKGIDRWVVLGYDSHQRVAFKTQGRL